jgi:hypothetical protein
MLEELNTMSSIDALQDVSSNHPCALNRALLDEFTRSAYANKLE